MPNNVFSMTEKHFVDIFEDELSKSGYLTKREIGAGHGIADLVVTKIDIENLGIRIGYKQRQPLKNINYFQVLRNIPDYKSSKEPVSFDFLKSITRLSSTTLKYSIIKNLKKYGYVKEVGNQKFVKINGWVPLSNEVIAFEAKIQDWRKGFYQASRYKSFADKVYLVIPEKYSHLPEKNMFERFGIGLMSFNPVTKKKLVICKPTESTVLETDKRNYIIEYFFEKCSTKSI